MPDAPLPQLLFLSLRAILAVIAAVLMAAPLQARDAQDPRLREASIAFLQGIYGERSGPRWPVRHQGKAYEVGFAFGWREPETERGLVIVAASGSAKEMTDGRYTRGFVQLFWLRDEGERLVEIARSQPIIDGAMGQPPAVDSVLAVGPGERRALLLHYGQSWQGQTRTDYMLYGLRRGDDALVRPLGTFAAHSGSCGQGLRSADCWSARVQFEALPAESTCWPLVLTRTQTSGTGRPMGRTSTRVACRADGTYATPPAYNGPFF